MAIGSSGVMDKSKVEDAPDRLRFTYPMYYIIFIAFTLFVNWTITHFEGCSPQLLHFALLALWIFVELATEYFIMWFFEDEISPFKRLEAAPGGLPKLKTFIYDIFSIIVMDVVTDLCTEYSIPLPEHQSLSWKPLELIDLPGLYFLFKLSWLLLNVFGLEVPHTMLHDMKFYHLHKHHHNFRKEVSMLNASFQFDFLDYFLEQKVGQILVCLLAYYFAGWIPVSHTVYFMILTFMQDCQFTAVILSLLIVLIRYMITLSSVTCVTIYITPFILHPRRTIQHTTSIRTYPLNSGTSSFLNKRQIRRLMSDKFGRIGSTASMLTILRH